MNLQSLILLAQWIKKLAFFFEMVTLISRCDVGNIILSALVAHKINAFDRDDGYCAHISIIHHVRPRGLS